MTAVRRLIDARTRVKRAKGSIARAEARLRDAREAGDEGKVARIEAGIARTKSALRRAKLDISRQQPVAQAVAAGLRAADMLLPKARRRDEQLRRERSQRAPSKRFASEHAHREDVTVDSPYGREQGVDKVQRVFHTIEDRRTGLNSRQKTAADRYRWAFEKCQNSTRCALDTSGRGGGSDMRSPTDDQRQAVVWLEEAARLLGVTDNVVIRRICGEGMTVEEVVRMRAPNGPAVHNHRKVVGDRLRTGLSVLADAWWPERHRMRTSRAPDARPAGADEREAWDPAHFKGRVAHAAPGHIYGFDPEGGQPGDPRRGRGKRNRQIKGATA